MSDKSAQAGSYAQAIMQAVVETWQSALNGVAAAMNDDASLPRLLGDKKRGVEEKTTALARVLPPHTPPQIVNLLLAMGQNGDLALLPQVAAALNEVATGRRAPAKAEVASADELSAEQKEQIRAKLAAEYGSDLDFSFKVDPALLGGLRVRVGDRLIDNSVANRLAKLRESLSTVAR